jgi:hypothetical protein
MKRNSHKPNELQSWKQRWEAVEREEVHELRHAPATLRYRQLLALMRLSQHLGWFDKMRDADDAAAEAQVRERWMKLKGSGRA